MNLGGMVKWDGVRAAQCEGGVMGRWPRGVLCPGSPRVCIQEASSLPRSDLTWETSNLLRFCARAVCTYGLLVQSHRRYTLSLVGIRCCASCRRAQGRRCGQWTELCRCSPCGADICFVPVGNSVAKSSGARTGEQSPCMQLRPGVPTCVCPGYSRCHQ